MEDISEQTIQVSKYNEAELQIMRLHECWLKAELYANSGKLIKWKFILDSIWRELYADVMKSEINKDRWLKKNAEILKEISEGKRSTELYFNLSKRHEFLKYIQDEVGKGGRYGDRDDEAPE